VFIASILVIWGVLTTAAITTDAYRIRATLTGRHGQQARAELLNIAHQVGGVSRLMCGLDGVQPLDLGSEYARLLSQVPCERYGGIIDLVSDK
jgi:hypothetical protein